jgi:hypothetical protein
MYNKFYNASKESEQIESYSKDLSNISKSNYTYDDEGIVGTAVDAVKGAWNGLKKNWDNLKSSVKTEYEKAKNNRANNNNNNVTHNNDQQNANIQQANTNIQNNYEKKMND